MPQLKLYQALSRIITILGKKAPDQDVLDYYCQWLDTLLALAPEICEPIQLVVSNNVASSTEERLILEFDYIDRRGRRTTHDIVVMPAFEGISIKITGSNPDNFKRMITPLIKKWLFSTVNLST